MGKACSQNEGGGRRVFKILTDKSTGRRPLGRPRRRCEDTVTMDLTEIGVSTKNSIDSTQGRNYWRTSVNPTLHLQVP